MNKVKKALLTLGVASALALGTTGLSATPFAPATQKAHAAYYSVCEAPYLDGSRWCYQMGCTSFEVRAYGCYTGWVLVRTWNA